MSTKKMAKLEARAAKVQAKQWGTLHAARPSSRTGDIGSSWASLMRLATGLVSNKLLQNFAVYPWLLMLGLLCILPSVFAWADTVAAPNIATWLRVCTTGALAVCLDNSMLMPDKQDHDPAPSKQTVVRPYLNTVLLSISRMAFHLWVVSTFAYLSTSWPPLADAAVLAAALAWTLVCHSNLQQTPTSRTMVWFLAATEMLLVLSAPWSFPLAAHIKQTLLTLNVITSVAVSGSVFWQMCASRRSQKHLCAVALTAAPAVIALCSVLVWPTAASAFAHLNGQRGFLLPGATIALVCLCSLARDLLADESASAFSEPLYLVATTAVSCVFFYSSHALWYLLLVWLLLQHTFNVYFAKNSPLSVLPRLMQLAR